MNVKNLIAVAMLGLMIGLSAACGPTAEPTPTRTPKAVAENNPTQTPWLIYIPITTTPEPATATALPTVTSSRPTRTPTNTRAPTDIGEPTNTRAATSRATATTRATATQRPPTAAAPTSAVPATSAATIAPPTAAAPTAAPSACGQTYQVTKLTFPENGATRTTQANPKGNQTIEFQWVLPISGKADPKVGYRVLIRSSTGNGTTVDVSHNTYLEQKKAILSQFAVRGLTNGDDAILRWTVTVIHASGGFNDPEGKALGAIGECGPASPESTINLAYQG